MNNKALLKDKFYLLNYYFSDIEEADEDLFAEVVPVLFQLGNRFAIGNLEDIADSYEFEFDFTGKFSIKKISWLAFYQLLSFQNTNSLIL